MENKKVKKIPLRKCLGCMQSFPKKELVRVVRTPENQVIIDLLGKANGRGAYICKCKECLKKAIKSKRITSSLEVEIPEEALTQLLQEIEKVEE
ncbi:MAG: YlxR family protein [Clostridia bacterium]|nr:YlxR family protein [Clostridia bacterium]